jgi:ribosomal protein S1
LHERDVVEGRVTGVVDFGAFVDLGEGVEGLVHVSEMPEGEATRSELETDMPVIVRVLEIDEWQHQIGLRLEEISPSPE